MKVVLLKDVKGKGKEGEIINVNEGYGRNFLIPNGHAKEATKETINSVNIKMAAIEHKKDVEKQDAKDLAKRIETLSVTVLAKSGEGGRLFGAVTNKEISASLKEQHNIDIDKKKITVSEPIKGFGTFKVSVKTYANVSGTLTVEVKAQ